jgi:hypothetical protein
MTKATASNTAGSSLAAMLWRMTSSSILPVLTLLLGWALSYWAERSRYRTQRRDSTTEALRSQRGEAYRKFIRDAHSSAHMTGRASSGCPFPIAGDRELALSSVDREVAGDLYELELFANEPTLEAARLVRQELTEFREVVLLGAEYMSEDYRSALGSYQRARSAFLATARRELVETPQHQST